MWFILHSDSFTLRNWSNFGKDMPYFPHAGPHRVMLETALALKTPAIAVLWTLWQVYDLLDFETSVCILTCIRSFFIASILCHPLLFYILQIQLCLMLITRPLLANARKSPSVYAVAVGSCLRPASSPVSLLRRSSSFWCLLLKRWGWSCTQKE